MSRSLGSQHEPQQERHAGQIAGIDLAGDHHFRKQLPKLGVVSLEIRRTLERQRGEVVVVTILSACSLVGKFIALSHSDSWKLSPIVAPYHLIGEASG